jgi:hypothetical protein
MSDREPFLARWLRKKGEAGAAEAAPVDIAATATEAAPGAPPSPAGNAESPPPVDPAPLPPIESIGPGSSISGFLAPGVPTALTRAALRRAWSSDPAVRDFIGLSENSGDFNALGGEHGFGRITAEEVERLLAQATGETRDATGAMQVAATSRTSASEAGPGSESPPDRILSTQEPTQGAHGSAHRGIENRAMQHDETMKDRESLPSRPRRHGTALPE